MMYKYYCINFKFSSFPFVLSVTHIKVLKLAFLCCYYVYIQLFFPDTQLVAKMLCSKR